MDDHGAPTGEACFTCADILGRIRPDLTHDQALDYLGWKPEDGKKNPDEKLRSDYDLAKEAVDAEEEGGFHPSSDVKLSRAWSYDIFQDYALLSSEEFTRITHLTPKQCQAKPIKVNYTGPGASEVAYMVGMQGMPLEEMLSCRKLRLKMTDSVP